MPEDDRWEQGHTVPVINRWFTFVGLAIELFFLYSHITYLLFFAQIGPKRDDEISPLTEMDSFTEFLQFLCYLVLTKIFVLGAVRLETSFGQQEKSFNDK